MKQSIKRYPELCIPRVSIDILKETIFNVFCRLNIGYIERITEIPLKSNPDFKRVIIKVKWNPSSDQAKTMYDLILKQEPVFIVYNFPWYWKVVLNQIPTKLSPPPAYISTVMA